MAGRLRRIEEGTNMADQVSSTQTVVPRGIALWICGLGVGLIGGFAMLTISPAAGLPVLLMWVWLAVRPPRFAGLAGAVVGHGAAWSLLLLASNVSCALSDPRQCSWSLAFGPAHLDDMTAWQTETRVWLAFTLVLVAVGVILTIWTARRLRSGVAAKELSA
jgi:hypothetical protein